LALRAAGLCDRRLRARRAGEAAVAATVDVTVAGEASVVLTAAIGTADFVTDARAGHAVEIRAARRVDATLARAGRRAAVCRDRAAIFASATLRAAARECAGLAIVAVAAAAEARDVIAGASAAYAMLPARAFEPTRATLTHAAVRTIVRANRIANDAGFAARAARLQARRVEAETVLAAGRAFRAVGVQVRHRHVHFDEVIFDEGEARVAVRDFLALPVTGSVQTRGLAGEAVIHVEANRLRRRQRRAAFAERPRDRPEDRAAVDRRREPQLIDLQRSGVVREHDDRSFGEERLAPGEREQEKK
jgi:hypothetical protein